MVARAKKRKDSALRQLLETAAEWRVNDWLGLRTRGRLAQMRVRVPPLLRLRARQERIQHSREIVVQVSEKDRAVEVDIDDVDELVGRINSENQHRLVFDDDDA
ncbi:MAG: hypothetical protein IH627_10710 [Rubrivivax sp.]|nr:hypothetical protein [Rubrivivax sp.]